MRRRAVRGTVGPMPDVVLIIVVALVPVAALVLSLACSGMRTAPGDAPWDATDGEDTRS